MATTALSATIRSIELFLIWPKETDLYAHPGHYALLNIDLWFNICLPTPTTMCYYLDRGAIMCVDMTVII